MFIATLTYKLPNGTIVEREFSDPQAMTAFWMDDMFVISSETVPGGEFIIPTSRLISFEQSLVATSILDLILGLVPTGSFFDSIAADDIVQDPFALPALACGPSCPCRW